MKGIIALDIDGTLLAPGEKLSRQVIDYLESLAKDNWQLLFITGRAFHWCEKALQEISFPYHLAVQNGAIVLEMPLSKIVLKKYLNRSILPTMQNICSPHLTDFIIYAGCEHEDLSYYRPHYFPEGILRYLRARAAAFGETWRSVESFEQVIPDDFAAVKCIGPKQEMQAIASAIHEELGLSVPLIRDPFNESYYVAQATHPEVSKGSVLLQMRSKFAWKGPIIAAGDDYNDLSMLQASDLKVVMATAPEAIRQIGNIIAPPATEKGIIKGLQEAILHLQN